MKKYLLVAAFSAMMSSVYSQVVNETVSIGANYTNQVFYSMQNGAFPSVDNTNWELAFQIRGFAASILINSKNNVHLYRSMKPIADWGTMTAGDTTGILNSTYELYNSDESWDYGAFSQTYDTSNAFDLGWGVYDFVTHAVNGDSIYFIQLPSGIYKKFAIESLTLGVYYFRWADLDGSNEITASLDKASFQNKFFGYYSIVNNNSIDREPVYNEWDLTFTQYLALTPFIYKVAGVLSNDSVSVAKAYPVDVNTVTASGQTFMPEINTIGYDWKTYDFSTNTWTIEDSLVYFVQDRDQQIWKVIFTGFGGAANGNYDFSKELVGGTGVGELTNHLLSLYPNPANEIINVVFAGNTSVGAADIRILNSTGQVVYSGYSSLSGLSSVQIPVNEFKPGIYHLMVDQDGSKGSSSFIVR